MDSQSTPITQVAVTGASGHIGNVVCRQLLEQGYKVKAFYNSDKTALADLDLTLIQGSVLNKADLETLIEGCEIVINCAALISIDGDPDGKVFRTNTEGPKAIWEVALAKGVKRMVHISSVHAVTELPHSQAYDETRPYKVASDYAYDYSKAYAEQLLLAAAKDQAMELVILRPSCVMGPYDFKPSKMGAALMDFYQQKIPVLPTGGYDLVDVRDVAASIIAAMHKGQSGEAYLLSGQYYDMKGLTGAIAKVTGKRMPSLVLPYWVLRAVLPFAGLYAKISKTSPSFTRESIDALIHGHPSMNNTKARKVLNHQTRSLEETLKDFFEWQQNKH